MLSKAIPSPIDGNIALNPDQSRLTSATVCGHGHFSDRFACAASKISWWQSLMMPNLKPACDPSYFPLLCSQKSYVKVFQLRYCHNDAHWLKSVLRQTLQLVFPFFVGRFKSVKAGDLWPEIRTKTGENHPYSKSHLDWSPDFHFHHGQNQQHRRENFRCQSDLNDNSWSYRSWILTALLQQAGNHLTGVIKGRIPPFQIWRRRMQLCQFPHDAQTIHPFRKSEAFFIMITSIFPA